MSTNDTQPPTRTAVSDDERALFNPAYLAAILAAGAEAHRRTYKTELPLMLAWVLPIMAVPRFVRHQLPGSIRPYLANWIEEHPLVRADLRRLAPLYTPATRQGLRFGIRHQILTLTPAGVSEARGAKAIWAGAPGEVNESLTAARLLSRWLPRSGPLPTTFTLLGLRP
jgi:hypothetical protein